MAVKERRHILCDLISPNNRVQFSEELEGEARDLFKGIESTDLEGMVSKRLGSRYRSGPLKQWLKAKCYFEDVFDVAGLLREPGKATRALRASKGNISAVPSPRFRKSENGCGRVCRRKQSRPKDPSRNRVRNG